MNKLGKAVLIAGATDIAWALHDSTMAGFNATKYDIECNHSGGFKQFVRLGVFRAADD